ncbi:unnamed protein product [Symbiodinium natans]|uniref:TIR domain-containing protein n=1 Tax=Symbiodinium natans TaxID=878477 RepID=A0A812KYA9_9DINO|nr:unnamed protein product [Symbiodinium natans]
MPPKAADVAIPDGAGARLAMFSARFDGGKVEQLIRQVHSILLAHNYEVLMVKAGAGDDFGKDTMTYLGKLLVQKGILLAVCTENYAEVTSSKYSSFEELKLAYDRNLDVIPLKVTQAYPPRPPHGPQHPFDKEGQAIGLLAMAMPTSKVYLDCLTKTGDLLSPHDIAARIAEKLREGTAKAEGSAPASLERKSSGHGGPMQEAQAQAKDDAQASALAASASEPKLSAGGGDGAALQKARAKVEEAALGSSSSAATLAGPAGSALRPGKAKPKALGAVGVEAKTGLA